MKPLLFKKVKFLKTAVKSDQFPYIRSTGSDPITEIAVLGRSNVGKSSLINHLLKQNIARTSSTPGKTQAINFFDIDDTTALFVDLPGYGYAKVPLKVRQEWGPMIQGYLENRPGLKLILMLLDVRRALNEADEQIIQWLNFYKQQTIFVFTKTDKLNQSEKVHQTRQILEKLDWKDPLYVNYSVFKEQPRGSLIQLINQCLA